MCVFVCTYVSMFKVYGGGSWACIHLLHDAPSHLHLVEDTAPHAKEKNLKPQTLNHKNTQP